MTASSPPERLPLLLLSALAGALLPLGFAPLSWWPLIPLCMAVLVDRILMAPSTVVWRHAFAFGLGFYGTGVSWVYVSIHFYGGTPAWLAVIGTALFVAFLSGLFFALPFALYSRLNAQRYLWLTFPAAWVLLEWTKSWLLSGFPWLWLGYGFIDSPLAGYAPVGGVLLISLICVLMAIALRQALRCTTLAARLLHAGIIVLGLLGGWGLQQVQWVTSQPEHRTTVALLQGNIPQEQKWDPAYRSMILDAYQDMTEAAWEHDIILWPEAAYPIYYHQALDRILDLNAAAQQHGTTVISGIPRWFPGEALDGSEDIYYNSIFAIGNGEGFYNKQKLVPFGEFVPLAALIRDTLPFFSLPLADFIAGAPDQAPLRVGELTFSSYICYEIVFPELVRREALDRDFMVTISNDAWFGRSWGPKQHFQMARMRALENGKPLLRGTNTGITAIIDAHGRVTGQIEPFQRATLSGHFEATQGRPPFTYVGHWPVLLICWISLLSALLIARRNA